MLRGELIDIGLYGWKIKNFKAATIIGKNLGVRDKYDFTPATIHRSLFTNWLQQNGMKTDKSDEATRDVICIDFQFGLRSYEEEKTHLKEMRRTANKIEDEEQRTERLKVIDDLEKKVDERKHLYRKMTKSQVREYLYVNGADITYSHFNKKTGEVVDEETIHYKMLYRSPSKAKTGSAIFLREELYDRAYDWLTMGIGPKMPLKNAKIVELSAYAPLATSAIEGTFKMDVDSILVVKDQESFFNTIADIIRADDYNVYETVTNPETGKKEEQLVTKKKCVVHRERTDVVNVAWDGEALIESDILPEFCNGMGLLRNHFFKACAFKAHIQQFFKDYCAEHGIDYDTFEVVDYFGNKHLAKNVKLITTENATKFKKFADLIGGDFASAYEYWKDRVRADGCVWGIVKTSHPSKLGELQRASYQAVNTLPCTEEEIYKITETSVKYVESLKFDNEVFISYLRKNANVVNSYDMLVDLYEHNPDIANTKFFRANKTQAIKDYVNVLRYGKILLPGDNLTVCGNPYGLLLHTVGEDWTTDPTLRPEEGCIQVYTRRFDDGEHLCGIRSPHNSSNNLGYYHNVRHPLMEKYFDFCPNIMAVNCICTDIQARLNGEDFDSDFNLVTNQPEMVEAAKRAYRDYPTVVNEIPESGVAYDNNLKEYARMDTNMQGAQKAIGGSSDTAQLALSYYWDAIAKNEDGELIKEYYNIAIILAVLA